MSVKLALSIHSWLGLATLQGMVYYTERSWLPKGKGIWIAEKKWISVRRHHGFNQLPAHSEPWVVAVAAANVESCGGKDWANWGKTGSLCNAEGNFLAVWGETWEKGATKGAQDRYLRVRRNCHLVQLSICQRFIFSLRVVEQTSWQVPEFCKSVN